MPLSRGRRLRVLLGLVTTVLLLAGCSAEMAGGRLVLLRDDAGLQPAENVVPVLRRRVLTDYGSRRRWALSPPG